jgi:hypothetical protein
MQTYKIWQGERTFLPGDDASKYTVIEIVAEDIGWFIELPDEGLLGKTYSVYRTESEIIIHVVQEAGLGDPSYGSIHRYRDLSEAAADGFEQVLKEMRLI